MRQKTLYLLCFLAACLLAIDTAVILLVLPDEAAQGAIYRIIFYHVPAAWTAFVGCLAALISSILYLVKRDLDYDAVAVAATEVGLAFGAANLVSGMIWGRVTWGIWWSTCRPTSGSGSKSSSGTGASTCAPTTHTVLPS